MQNLQALDDDLNKKFKEQLDADLTVQSEGLWDKLHHNAAVKIAYAKRKLSQSIATKEEEISGLQKMICEQCLPMSPPLTKSHATSARKLSSGSDNLRLNDYCTLCPSAEVCQESPVK